MSNANKIARYITTIDSTQSYAVNVFVVKPMTVTATSFFFLHTLLIFLFKLFDKNIIIFPFRTIMYPIWEKRVTRTMFFEIIAQFGLYSHTLLLLIEFIANNFEKCDTFVFLDEFKQIHIIIH